MNNESAAAAAAVDASLTDSVSVFNVVMVTAVTGLHTFISLRKCGHEFTGANGALKGNSVAMIVRFLPKCCRWIQHLSVVRCRLFDAYAVCLL